MISKKTIQRTAIYLALVISMLAAVFFLIVQGTSWFLGSKAGRDFLLDRINSSIIGQVSLEDISISPISGKIRIKEAGLKGPGGSPIARIGMLDADLDLSELYKGRIKVSRLDIIRPEFFIFETAGGRLNILSISKPTGKGDEGPGGGLPLNIIINDARIIDGMAVYGDRNIKASLAGLRVLGSYDLGLNSGFIRAEIPSAIMDVPGFMTGFSPLKLEAGLEKGDIKSLCLDAVTGFGRLSIRGGIKNVFNDPYFDLVLDANSGLGGIRKACGLDMGMNGMAALTLRATGTMGNPEAYARLMCRGGKLGNLEIRKAEAESYIKNRIAVIRLKAGEPLSALDIDGYADLASAFPFSFFTEKMDMNKFGYGLGAKINGLGLKTLSGTDGNLKAGRLSGKISCDLKGVSLSSMSGTVDADIIGKNFAGKNFFPESEASPSKKAMAGDLGLKAGISLSKGTVDMRNIKLNAQGTSIKGKGWYSIPSEAFSASVRIDSPDMGKIADFTGLLKARGSLEADADISGTIISPVFKLKARADKLGIEDFTLGNLEMDAGLDGKGDLKISRLELKNKSSELSGSGSVRILGNGPASYSEKPASLKLSLKNFDPSFFLSEKPPFSGTLDADLTAKNRINEKGVPVPSAEINANARNLWVSGVSMGSASLKAGLSGGILDIGDLTLKNRGSELSLAMKIGLFTGKGIEPNKNPDINAFIRNAALRAEDFIQGAEGEISASGNISGTFNNPSGRMNISASRLVLDKTRLGSLDLKSVIKGKRLEIEGLEIKPVEKESLVLRGWMEKNGDYSLDMDSEGISLSILKERLGMPGLSGMMSASLSGKGNLNRPVFSGRVFFKGLGSGGQTLDDFGLSLDLANFILRMDSVPDPGIFNFRADLKRKSFETDLGLKSLDLSPFLKAGGLEDFSGKTDLTFLARGRFDRPEEIRAETGIKNLDLKFRDFDLLTCNYFKAAFRDGMLSLDPSDMRIMKKGSMSISGGWGIKSGPNLNIRSILPLSDAAPLIPDILPDLGGMVSAEASIIGSPASPSVKGEISLKDVGFTMPETSQKLHDLSGTIKMTPGKVVFEKIRGMMDDGNFSLAGQTDLEGLKAKAINLRLRARNLPLSIPDTAELMFNMDLNLSGSQDAPFVSGEAALLEGVYYRDVDLSLVSIPKKPSRKKPPFWETIENPFLKNMGFDITLRKREALKVDNNFAELELSPDLRLTGMLSAPIIGGRCKVDSGSIFYRKNEYEIKKGVIDFINPYEIAPELDIESSSKIKKWTVTLKISGTPENLDFDLSSDPPLDDNDILSLVILGNVTKDVSAGQAARKPASEMLGEMLASTFSDEIKSVSGLDIIETGGTGSADDDVTRVTLGKNLSRRLAVKYTVDSKAGEVSQKALAEYKLLENLILNGFRDTQGVYGGELKYRLEFR